MYDLAVICLAGHKALGWRSIPSIVNIFGAGETLGYVLQLRNGFPGSRDADDCLWIRKKQPLELMHQYVDEQSIPDIHRIQHLLRIIKRDLLQRSRLLV